MAQDRYKNEIEREEVVRMKSCGEMAFEGYVR